MDAIKFGLVFEPLADKAFRTFSKLSEEAKQFSFIVSNTGQDIDRFGIKLTDTAIEADKAGKEIAEFAKGLEDVQKEGKESFSILECLKDKFSAIASIGLGGFTFGAITKELMDVDGLARRIVANTTLGWEKVALLKKDILELHKQTGASAEEIAETVQNIIQQYGTWNEEVKKAAEMALKLTQITGHKYEPTELIHAAMQMKRSFKDIHSLEEAFQHIYVILQNAGNASGDLLDTLREYSPILGESGLKAKEFAGVLISAAKAGAFNFDKVADILKEGFKAGLAEGSNLQDLMQKLNNIQQQYADLVGKTYDPNAWLKLKSAFVDYISAVQSGNKELQKKSYIQIMELFAKLYKKNKLVAKELMQQVFGTIGTEDVAIKVVQAMAEGLQNADKYYKTAKKISETSQKMYSPWQRLSLAIESVKTELATALEPLVDKLAWGLEKVAGFIQDHSTLAAWVTGIGGALLTLGGAVKLLGGAFGLVKSGLSAVLSPLGLFKTSLAESCSKGTCIGNLKEEFKGLGKTIDFAKGKLGKFRAKPLSLGKKFLAGIGGFLHSGGGGGGSGIFSKIGGGLLSKASSFLGKLGLKGLARVGLNFLGPVGWAINAGLMAWDAWNLIKDTGIGKAIKEGVGKAWSFAKSVGKSLWGGIKSVFGLEENKTAEPIAKETSTLHKVAEAAKFVSPLGFAMTVAGKIGGWLSHLFGGGEKKEEKHPLHKQIEHFEKLHKEVVQTKETQKVETVEEAPPSVEFKPNVTFNVQVSATEPQKIKEEILQTLEKLTPDVLNWLERALEELRHRHAPAY